MNNKNVKKVLTVSGIILALLFFNNCSGWMEDDGFFDTVENEVFVANAESVDVFVRCSNSGWGITVPSGYSVFKQNVPSSVSVTPGSGYGFWKWAAFSTSDFNAGKQNNSFIYTSIKEYEEKLAAKELSLNDVSFANPKESSTSVTVKTTRNDIAVVPVFVKLATMQSCTPSNGASGVAVNSTVRLTFSRDISANNIEECITILQGNASPKDITENFDITVSGKTITCKFKTDSELTNFSQNQPVELRYSEDIRDTEGYPIAESGLLKFRVGDANNIDNTAPKITEVVYGHPASSAAGKFTVYYDETAADGITGKNPSQIKSAESTFFDRRIKDTLSISVSGVDYVGNASKNTPDFNTVDSIGNIAIKAQTVMSSTGEKIANGSTKNFEYEYFDGSFEDINLGELDDGLIRLQIGLVDNSGNSSLDKIGYYSAYDNGYKTIFVVKDTTAPDAAVNSGKIKISSQDYSWFNASSIANLKFLNDKTLENGVSDNGNEYFRSKSENLKWIFHAGKASSWTKPAANDSGWKSINEGYAFGSQLSDLVQGSNPVCVAFMDDVGNISEIADVSASVMYDDVKPAVGTDIKWVRNDNSEEDLVLGITGQKVVTNQSLYVPIIDETSGIKEMTFVVSNNGTARTDSLSSNKLKIFYIATELESGVDYTISGNTLKFTVPKEKGSIKVQGLKIDDESVSGDAVYKIKVNIVDAAGNKSEDIVDEPQISRDSVTPVISKVVIPPVEVDGVKVPVIESVVPYGLDGSGTAPVYFAGIQSGLDYSTGKIAFTLDFYITEQTSGVQQITFDSGCNVRLSPESTLSVIHSGSTKDLVKNTDYIVDETGKIITFRDSVNPLVKDENGEFVLSITKCSFENVKYKGHENASDENNFSFTLKDFAQLSPDSPVTTVKASESGTENIATVVADVLPAKITSVRLEDKSPCDNEGNVEAGKGDGPYDLRKSEEGFTNYEIINIYVDSPEVNDSNKNYSVKKITLSGAKFITAGYEGKESYNTGVSVAINGTSYPLSSSDYKITDDNSSIEFNKSFDAETNFLLFNILLDTTNDGEKTVSATAYSPAGVSYTETSVKNGKIILDKTPPALATEGPFAYDNNNTDSYRNYEYPRQVSNTDYETYGISAKDLGLSTYTSMAGNTGTDIKFFYTSKGYRRLPVKVEDANSLDSNYLQIKVVNKIKAGEATSKAVLENSVYKYGPNPLLSTTEADFKSAGKGKTVAGVVYCYYGSQSWSSNLNPYTYVATDKAGNVSEPHQFYVIADDKSPSITVDGTDYGTATDAVRKSKSLTNLMELVIPDGKRVFRNTVENTASGIYDASEFNFWNDKDGHVTTSLSSYQYVLPEGEFKIKINLKSGVSSGTMLIGGVSGSDVSSYSQRIPTPGDSGLAKWAITHYYKKWNSTATESNWDAAWPVGTLGAAFFDSRVTWNDYDGGDIVYTIPDSSKGVPPLTLLLMDNCANIYQIPIRPASMDAPMTEYTLDSVKFPCHSGENVSWIYDKKLPGVVKWSQGVEDTLDDQFIIFAGGCDDDKYKNISGASGYPEGNTYLAVGNNRFGALYRDTENNIQYYNHKVYLQLLVKSKEPILWDAQETRTNNVQPLFENGSQPSDFTLRARVLFREGTDANEPEESVFTGMSSASLTKWSYFKQKSTDGKRLWNILMPHGDEGKLGTLWLYLEDYVGNKGIYRIKNGNEDKFVWNDEPPKVKLRTVADYPADYDAAKTATNASKFSSFGTYRHYNHLAFTSEADIKRLVPPTVFKKKYIKTQTSNMSDSRYSAMIDKAEVDGLIMNNIHVIGDTTYVGDTAYNVSAGDNAREAVGNNTYAVNPVLCFFDIDVSDSPSGIDGYRYCFADNEGDDNRQDDWEGNKSNGYWYINHTDGKNDSKRVNAQIPVNLSYIEGAETEYNKRTFNLYIRDRVGNVSVTKLGNKWMMDNSYPATASGATWTGGKAIPGNSYLSLPGADSREQIDVTIAGSSEAFKTASENGNPYSIKIPADWFTDFQKRTDNGNGTGTSSGVYGTGLIPNVMGSAKPVSADGYLTVDIPHFVYKDADATNAQTLEYYIFDKTGNYWTCNLKVKVDESAPTMRVGVTRYGNDYTFHSEDNLYTKVFGTGALPKDIAPDTTTTAEERISYQGNALNTFSESEGYSNKRYEKLYSLASNVSKQYSSKADVDYAYLHGTEDERSRFFKIRSNNAAFFVNVWAVDDGGISQVSIRKWGNNEWVDQTDQGKIVFTNENQNVKQMLFEKIPDVVSLENNGKEISKEGASSIRNSIYVSTAGQFVENLYEVSATDFAGNAVFYYAYILPFDNAGPSVTDVTVAGNPGSSVVGDNFYFNTLNFSLKASDAGAGLGAYWISAKQKSKYKKFDGNISNTAVDSTLFEEGCKEFWVYVQDVLGNEKIVENFTVSGVNKTISNFSFVYDKTAPSITGINTVKRTGTTYVDNPVTGTPTPHSENNAIDSTYVEVDEENNTIWIKNRNYPSTLKVSMKTAAAGTADDDVRGYIVTDGNTKPSFDASLIVDEITVVTDTDLTTYGISKYIWVVDHAGNISESYRLNIKYKENSVPVVTGGEVKIDDESKVYVDGNYFYYGKDGASAELKVAPAPGDTIVAYEIVNASAAPKHYISMPIDDSSVTQIEGGYKINLPEVSGVKGSLYVRFRNSSHNYSEPYKLVYNNNSAMTYTFDDVAPSCTTNSAEIRNGSNATETYYSAGEIKAVEGTWYELKDNGVGNDYTTRLYTSGTKVSLKVSDTLACSKEYSYAFTYGSYDDILNQLIKDSNQNAPESWSEYTQADNNGWLTVTLPDVETIMHGYLMIWLKDRVGNISCPYNMSYPTKIGENWLGMYNELQGATWSYSGNTLTINGYSASAGLKIIKIVTSSGGSIYVNNVNLGAANSRNSSYDISINKVYGTSPYIISLGKSYMTSGNITLNMDYSLNITNVFVTDAADVEHEIDKYETRSFFSYFVDSTSDAVSTVSNAITSIFGRSFMDRTIAPAERNQIKADRKLARQTKIAAAKEAKRQRKLLAKQQRESSRLLSGTVVSAETIEESSVSMEKKNVSAVALASSSTDSKVNELVPLNEDGSIQVQDLQRSSSRDAVVIAIVLAIAIASSGVGFFLYRKKKNIN